MSLSIEAVTVKIQGNTLLSNVSLECKAGQVLGVVGENGAGKSTFLNVLSGLLEPTTGVVAVNGRAMHEHSSTELAQIRAMLPQSSELSFPLNAIEVVRLAFSLSAYPLARQTKLLEKCLSQFNVLSLAHRNYLTLSGGEKQRVQLARVMAQLQCHQPMEETQPVPQYLLLDEPISALDLYQQYQTLTGIRELARQGIGVVAILHDLNLASLYCDRLAIIRRGKVFAQGTPSDVMTPNNIKRAFNIDARIQPHPDTKTPFLIPRVTQPESGSAVPMCPLTKI